MNYLFNSPHLKQNRQQLRNNPTDAENKLWYYLRNCQFQNLRFRRQYSCGNFILDFYCPQIRLGIEVDGGQHNILENQAQDAERTEYLKRKGIKIIRFWNHEILSDIDGVLGKLTDEIVPPPPPS
jgi:very-short-patch-repair endonuclease